MACALKHRSISLLIAKRLLAKARQGLGTRKLLTRQGIDYLQAHLGIVVTFETVLEWSDPEAGRYVIKATGTMARKDGSPHVISSFGETSKANNTNPYPVAMCEKRALSRVVLKLVGMYELGAVGEDEL